MKKFFVIAAAAAISFCACTKDDTNKVQGSGNNDADKGSAGLVLNELSGADKFIELYNTTDAEISLEGCYLVKYDSSKEAGRPTKEQEKNSPNYSADFRSDDSVGQVEGVSGDTVRNYISLLNLTPPLLEMVDNGTIALTPAYQLTHLAPDEQEMLLTAMDSEQATPSVSQAQRIRKLSQSGKLDEDSMLQIMMEQKKPERNDITLSGEKLRKYFPRSYSPQRIEETIFKLLDAWMRKRQRDNSR